MQILDNPVSEIKLKFPEEEILRIAQRYSYPREEQVLLDIRIAARESGFLTKDQIKTVALWKAPRAAGHIDKNDPEFVREMTSLGFSAKTERARIEILTLIDGVRWPTASVILHLFHEDPYPILDFRALWSVGLEVPNAYTFEFWWPYVDYCRAVAHRSRIDMRMLDRALWQFSKENQSSSEPVFTPRGTGKVQAPRSGSTLKKEHAPISRHPNPQNIAGTVYWVSCVSRKRSAPAPAMDLYVSDWFLKARAYVESTGAPWFILSAKYGLVDPNQVIAPYELTLNTMRVEDRRRWAEKVFDQLAEQTQRPEHILMLAGARYREFLEPGLTAMGTQVDVPMQGLRIGEQLSWLNQQSQHDIARRQDLERFYELLDQLKKQTGGMRKLADCHGRMNWPDRGVYFFFEPGEVRSDNGSRLRVVRVGTHALKDNSRTTLWNRLSQHRGTRKTGGGNHRGSIFRLILGAAIKRREHHKKPTSWGIGNDAGTAARKLDLDSSTIQLSEMPLEQAVSKYIGEMPFLWLDINDSPGVDSLRGIIEKNSIALLSNFGRDALDFPSSTWLGLHSDRERIRQSGLWNSNHIDETYDPDFLLTFQHLIITASYL